MGEKSQSGLPAPAHERWGAHRALENFQNVCAYMCIEVHSAAFLAHKSDFVGDHYTL